MDFARALVRTGRKPDLFCAAGMGSLDDVKAHFDESGALRPGAARTGSTRTASDGSRLPCPPPTEIEQVSDALGVAARNGHAGVVRFLLARRPDLSFRGYMGATPLHWAYFGGSLEAVDLLLRAGADPASRDGELRCTPRAFGVSTLANWGFLEMLRRRLDADPTLVNVSDGRTTPLHEAARGGNRAVVALLLERGADRSLRDGDGRTPLDVAVERGD